MQTPASQESQSLRFTKNPAACCLDGKTNFINSAHNKNDKHKVPCPFHIYILFLSSFLFLTNWEHTWVHFGMLHKWLHKIGYPEVLVFCAFVLLLGLLLLSMHTFIYFV